MLDASKHYRKQAPLKGSIREVRGRIVVLLGQEDSDVETLAKAVGRDERFDTALEGLVRDGLVQRRGDAVHLTKH